MGRVDQVARHETQLDERLIAGLEDRIKDFIDEGPIINRVAGLIFEVSIGRAPLVEAVAVARAE